MPSAEVFIYFEILFQRDRLCAPCGLEGTDVSAAGPTDFFSNRTVQVDGKRSIGFAANELNGESKLLTYARCTKSIQVCLSPSH